MMKLKWVTCCAWVFVTLCCFAVESARIQQEEVITLANLKAKAVQANKHIAVLYTGNDVMDACNDVRTNCFYSTVVYSNYVTAVVDVCEDGYAAANTQKSNLSSIYPMGGNGSEHQHTFPGIALYDQDAKLYALFAPVDNYETVDTLNAKFNEAYAAYEQFAARKAEAIAATTTELQAMASIETNRFNMTWNAEQSKAFDAAGNEITVNIYKAALMTEAILFLEPFVFEIPLLKNGWARSSEINQLTSWDPADVSGGKRRLLEWEYFNYFEKINAYITEGNYRAAESILYSLTNTTGSIIQPMRLQQQEGLIGCYNYSRKRGWTDVANELLDRIMEMGRYTFWGEGAFGESLHRQKTGPASLTWGWDVRHTEPTWDLTPGADLYCTRRGWHKFTMTWSSGSDITITNAVVTLHGTNTLFQAGEETGRYKQAGEADQYVQLRLPITLNAANKTMSFNFFLPESIERNIPLQEKDVGGGPSAIGIVLGLKHTGTSKGSFSLNKFIVP